MKLIYVLCIISQVNLPASDVIPKDLQDQDHAKLSVAMITTTIRSHIYPFLSIAQALGQRGHSVTFLTAYIPAHQATIREIESNGFNHYGVVDISNVFHLIDSYNGSIPFSQFLNMRKDMSEAENALLRVVEQDVSKYDVILVETMNHAIADWLSDSTSKTVMELALSIIHNPTTLPSWPYPIALPSINNEYSADLSFWDRISSILASGVLQLTQFSFFTGKGGLSHPLLYSTSIGLDYSKPVYPMTHYVGPLIPKRDKVDPFPIDLKEWLDEHKRSTVVYISMGSLSQISQLRASSLIPAIVESGYDVVWSLRDDNRYILDGIDESIWNSSRVYISKWLPQSQVLSHPAMFVAALHGGMGGINDAISSGVPILCLPIGQDQFLTCNLVHDQGLGFRITDNKMSKKYVSHALQKLTDDKFKKNAERMAEVFKSSGGAERSADLIEYYHRIGYDHLVPAFIKYKWGFIKYHNIDVKLTIAAFLFGAAILLYWSMKRCFQCCRRSKVKKD